eukprot:6861503-Prymnesium_polylepis.1
MNDRMQDKTAMNRWRDQWNAAIVQAQAGTSHWQEMAEAVEFGVGKGRGPLTSAATIIGSLWAGVRPGRER